MVVALARGALYLLHRTLQFTPKCNSISGTFFRRRARRSRSIDLGNVPRDFFANTPCLHCAAELRTNEPNQTSSLPGAAIIRADVKAGWAKVAKSMAKRAPFLPPGARPVSRVCSDHMLCEHHLDELVNQDEGRVLGYRMGSVEGWMHSTPTRARRMSAHGSVRIERISAGGELERIQRGNLPILNPAGKNLRVDPGLCKVGLTTQSPPVGPCALTPLLRRSPPEMPPAINCAVYTTCVSDRPR